MTTMPFMYNISFRTRAIYASSLVIVILVFGGAISGFFVYKSYKLPSLYEQRLLELKNFSLRVQTLSNSLQIRAYSENTFYKQLDPSALNLTRLPQGNELFLGLQKNAPVLVGYADKRGYWILPFETKSDFWEGREDVAFVISNRNTLGGTNRPALISSGNLQNNESVKEFFGSGLSKGILSLSTGKNTRGITGFSEVPGTNMIAFLEDKQRSFFSAYRTFLSSVFLTGGILLSVVIAFLFYCASLLFRPISMVKQSLAAVTSSRSSERMPEYEYNDEFREILSSIDAVRAELASRERRLHQQKLWQQCFLNFLARNDLTTSFRNSISIFSEIALSMPFSARVENLTFFLFTDQEIGEPENPGAWTIKSIDKNRLAVEPEDVWHENAKAILPGNFFNEPMMIMENSLYLPLHHEGQRIGFASLTLQQRAELRFSKEEYDWVIAFVQEFVRHIRHIQDESTGGTAA